VDKIKRNKSTKVEETNSLDLDEGNIRNSIKFLFLFLSEAKFMGSDIHE